MLRRDFELFQECISLIYGHYDLETFPQHMLSVIKTFIPADYLSYNLVDNEGVTVPSLIHPNFDRPSNLAQIFNRLAHEHPILQYHRMSGDGSAKRISDFMPKRTFHKLALYNEFYQPLRTEFQMAITIPVSEPYMVGVALNREDCNFSKRDIDCLNYLRPHLGQAFDLAWRLHKPQPDSEAYISISVKSLRKRFGLTNQEAKILYWIAQGKSNQDIADILFCKRRVIEKHNQHIFEKLSVENRSTATHVALEFLWRGRLNNFDSAD